jgi:hypothetical protein
MKFLVVLLLSSLSLNAFSQSDIKDTVIFKDGIKVFQKRISREIDKSFYMTNITHNIYVNVNMTINGEGKIKRIDFSSVDDSVFSKILYDALMQTDGGWVNSSKEDQIFNIFFEVRYAVNAIDKEAPIKCYSDIYEDGKLKKVTRHEKFQVIVYSTQY